MKIQQSMLRSYHAFAKSHPLIDVTFSTPTGFINNNAGSFRPLSLQPDLQLLSCDGGHVREIEEEQK